MKRTSLNPLICFACATLTVGCAFQKPAIETAVGSREVRGEVVRFSSETDLTVSGLVDEGLGYARKGRNFDAESRLRQALYLVPESDAIRFNLAIVLGRQGYYEEALGYLEPLLEKSPLSLDYLGAIAQVHFDAEHYEQAIGYFKRAFQLAKKAQNSVRAGSIARTISSVFYQIGFEQESLCYSYEAYSQKPNAEELFNHGRLMMSLGLFSAANDFIDKAIESDKSLKAKATALYSSGLAKVALGEPEAAYLLFDRALDYVQKEQSLGAELSAAWYVMRLKKDADTTSPEELGDKEQEEFDKIRDAALEFGKSNPRAFNYWPSVLISDLEQEVERSEADE